MTVLAAQDITWEIVHSGRLVIEPFYSTKEIANGMSYGLSVAGYDVRLKLPPDTSHYDLQAGEFMLGVTVEYISIPDDLIIFVHDKSTLARKGIAVQNTVLEPGWRGYTTLELTNHSKEVVRLFDGQPIAQFIFHRLSNPTNIPYSGKYQDQPGHVVEAIMEEPTPTPTEDIGNALAGRF